MNEQLTCFRCDTVLNTQCLIFFPDGSKDGREWTYCSLECFNEHMIVLDMLKKEENES